MALGKKGGPAEAKSKAADSVMVGRRSMNRRPKRNGEGDESNSGKDSGKSGSSDIVGEEDDEGDETAVGNESQLKELTSQDIQNARMLLDAIDRDRKAHDQWPKEFLLRLDAVEKKEVALLREWREDIETTKTEFTSHIKPILEAALAPIDDAEANRPARITDAQVFVAHPTTSSQSYFRNIVGLITDCKSLTARYQKVADLPAQKSILPGLREELVKDEEAIKRSIAAARMIKKADVEGLCAGKKGEARGRKSVSQDDAARGRVLLEMGIKGDKEADEDCDVDVEDFVGLGAMANELGKRARQMDGVWKKTKEIVEVGS